MNHWLDIIGVGEAGIGELPPLAGEILGRANIIIGSKKYLAALPAIDGQQRKPWQTPLAAMIEQVLQYRGAPTVILATGDPNWFGIGATLSRHLGENEFAIHPALSAFQLAAAKMRWPLQNIVPLSLHGRAVENLHSHILPGNRILALTSNAATLDLVAELLVARQYANSEIRVLENLGGAHERLLSFSAGQADKYTVGDFYILAIECIAGREAPLLPATPGLPDDAFVHDGQLSKRQVRAATLAALAPFPGALLWDVGAGSGSVAIEWMRAAPGAKAICFERDKKRGKNIATNARNLGTPNLKTVTGTAPQSLDGQPAPDAIFIGGSVAEEAIFKACWQALKPGGRLVANAVTLAGQSALFNRLQAHGGELCSIAVSTLGAVGGQKLLRPRLPVHQWSITKPATGGQ